VSADYSSGRTEDVAALAHTVKGSAAYLDAHELCECAQRLEESARRCDGVAMEMLIPAFRQRLETVLAHLNHVISQPVEQATPPAVRVDLPAVLQLITQAEPLIANGDYAAQTLLDRIVDLLEGTASARLAEEARAYFEELDLEPSLGMLGKLRDHLQQQTAGEIQR
jgi:two-component system, sensor histidine kinase and response regulator